MGADIHWIIERRHRSGTWHAVGTDMHSWRRYYDSGQFRNYPDNCPPDIRLNDRNYDLFSLLSDVRSEKPVRKTVMIPREPASLSEMGRAELDYWGEDAHSAGYAMGNTLFALLEHKNEDLKGFAETIKEVLDSGVANLILPLFHVPAPDEERIYPDLDDTESAHDRLARIRESEGLLSWKDDPDSIRMIVFYDN